MRIRGWALQFDRAELNGGQSLAIHSVIESVEPPVDLAVQNQNSSMDAMPTGAGYGGGAMADGRASGSGAMAGGGPLRGIVGGGANTTTGEPGVGLGTGSTVGGRERATTGAAGDATARAGFLRLVPGASGIVVAHATGVEGVSLANQGMGFGNAVCGMGFGNAVCCEEERPSGWRNADYAGRCRWSESMSRNFQHRTVTR
jgi:hypothetical protein